MSVCLVTCRQTVKVTCWLLTTTMIAFYCWTVDYNYNASPSTQTLKSSCGCQPEYVTANSHHSSMFYTAAVMWSRRGQALSHYFVYADQWRSQEFWVGWGQALIAMKETLMESPGNILLEGMKIRTFEKYRVLLTFVTEATACTRTKPINLLWNTERCHLSCQECRQRSVPPIPPPWMVERDRSQSLPRTNPPLDRSRWQLLTSLNPTL